MTDDAFTLFDIDEAQLRRTLGELTARGADQAELFFQRLSGSSILYQDGIVSRAEASVDRGVGLRCVVGDQTGYAYTEELTSEAMRDAARAAASIADGTSAHPAVRISRSARRPDRYPVQTPWRDVGVDAKLPVVRRVAELARAADPSIVKVEVSWSDGESRVLIADLAGRVVHDERPMTRMSVTVTTGESSM